MAKINIRAITAFLDGQDEDTMASFVNGIEKLENNRKIRTKRLAIDLDDFSENNLTKIAGKITDLGYWGFSVSFNDPNDSEQIKNAKQILQHLSLIHI